MSNQRDKNGRFVKAEVEKVDKNLDPNGYWTPVGQRSRGASFAGSVDLYGNLPEPSAYELVNAYEDIIYACVNLIAHQIAHYRPKLCATTVKGQSKPKKQRKALGLKEKERLHKDYKKYTRKAINVEEIVEHPLIDLLDRPNPNQNYNQLMGMTQVYMELTGSAFWLLNKVGGKPVEIHCLPSQSITFEYDEKTGYVNGYTYQTLGTNTRITYKPDDIIHFRFYNPNDPIGSRGVGPVRAAWQQIQLLRQEQSSWQAVITNMAFPSAIVSPGGKEADSWTPQQAEQMAKTIEERFSVGNQGGVWVVNDSINYTPVSTPPKDLTALAMYEQLKTRLLNVFHIPNILLDMSEVNGDAANTARRSLQMDCLKPRIVNNMDTITEVLCKDTDYDGRLFFCTDDIVEPDRQYELQKMSAMWQAGLMSQNEARATQGMEPVVGGDKYIFDLLGDNGTAGIGTLPSFQEGKKYGI